MLDDGRPPIPPVVLERRHTDEYVPPPLSEAADRARAEVLAEGEDSAKRVGQGVGGYWAGRLGTAAALLAMNRTHGERYFEVPEQAALDAEAAAEGFAGIGPVIDVQTHFIADQRHMTQATAILMASYRNWAPEWWTGLDGMVGYGFAEFLRCIFVESESIAAVLTAPPADQNGDRFLDNFELAGTREILDRMAGTGRLFNHVVVHPSLPGELDRMVDWSADLHPIGWKVYTAGGVMIERGAETKSTAFMLDDEESGLPFLSWPALSAPGSSAATRGSAAWPPTARLATSGRVPRPSRSWSSSSTTPATSRRLRRPSTPRRQLIWELIV